MTIKLNNRTIQTPNDEMTLEELLVSEGISMSGTAIARNGKLVPRTKWHDEIIKENDDFVIISAAFGG